MILHRNCSLIAPCGKNATVTRMERNTKQRNAIRQAFEIDNRPLSPDEVLKAAQLEVQGMGIATVYRTIKELVRDGVLHVVDLPGEPSRYELSGKDHHHHFHCRDCGKVYEIEGCPGNLGNLTPRGFRLERHEVILYGLCKHCRAG